MTMASVALPTADGLMGCWRRCKELRLAMKERSAGGKGVSGRYRKHDSARVRCLERLIEPRLKMGMLPTSYDEKMLFEYPGPDDIDGPAKQEMDAWSDIHYRHPRKGNTAATAAADAAMPLDDQTALLNWLRIDGPGSVARHRVRAPAGRPRTAFRISKILPGSEWKDHTIAQLKHESNRSRAFVQWLCRPDTSFVRIFRSIFRSLAPIEPHSSRSVIVDVL